MNREKVIREFSGATTPWDFVVIGGGATGLGTAVDAASRGYRTLLLEQHDFAKGTSSRSTKLVHGGVRYLKQGNISLVLEALKERGLLAENARHLVRHLAFIVPIYRWWEGPFYGVGLKVYDRLAGRLGLGPSKILSRAETLRRIPTLEPRGLQRGVIYYDGQFDDARLAVNLMQTLFDLGGLAANYMKVYSLLKKDGLVCGVVARDLESGEEHHIRARVVINATGVFTDGVRRMDEPGSKTIIAASQGAHMVLPKSFLPGDSGIMVPRTKDGRVLFAVPWHDHVVVGTTDTPVDKVVLEPRALPAEIDFLFTHAARYLRKDPQPSDVLSVFAGLRPLVQSGDSKSTAALSRDHHIFVSQSGLLTITGGKWTTYRKMAEDAVDHAEVVAGLQHRQCRTEHLRLHGWMADNLPGDSPLQVYGSDATAVQKLAESEPALQQLLSPHFSYLAAQVVWAVRSEMARTVEDVLARRTRALLLGAKASMDAAPKVAALMARELGRDKAWQKKMVGDYLTVARRYVLT